MAQMIRKQVYIRKQQEARLKRLAKARGVSEAELIRQALDRELGGGSTRPLPRDETALDEIIHFALSRRRRGSIGMPYKWSRDDAYEERLSRFD